MTSAHSDSPYVKLRAAEVLAEEGKLIDAEAAYKAATAVASPVPCAFAEYGITLLRQQKTAAARQQFEHELKTGSHCGSRLSGRVLPTLPRGMRKPRSKGLRRLRMPIQLSFARAFRCFAGRLPRTSKVPGRRRAQEGECFRFSRLGRPD